jgi:hypothetical protein
MEQMLKKEIKVSDSKKKQIEDIFAAEILENEKKGWEEVCQILHQKKNI